MANESSNFQPKKIFPGNENQDPFRVYFRIKVKEGSLTKYLTLVLPLIERIRDSEPGALQFESFCNKENNEVVWLQSYHNASDFDVHMQNPKINDLSNQMKALQESYLDIFFMRSPTNFTLKTFEGYGLQATILDGWPGTIRLGEARDEEHNIQSIVTVDLKDMGAYRTISEKVEAAAADQPGIAFHRSYQMNDHQIIAYEEYANDRAVLDWIGVFAEHAEGFGSLVNGMSYRVFGSPVGECKKMLDSWGAIYYEKVAGFTRFS